MTPPRPLRPGALLAVTTSFAAVSVKGLVPSTATHGTHARLIVRLRLSSLSAAKTRHSTVASGVLSLSAANTCHSIMRPVVIALFRLRFPPLLPHGNRGPETLAIPAANVCSDSSSNERHTRTSRCWVNGGLHAREPRFPPLEVRWTSLQSRHRPAAPFP